MITEYKKYIVLKFLTSLIKISLIFCSIILIMNLFEEINFFKDVENQNLSIPLFLTIINLDSSQKNKYIKFVHFFSFSNKLV